MSWKQRWLDMVLAGGAGALSAVACTDGSGAGSDAGSDGDVPMAVCCNANSDPCCPPQHCGAPMTVECTEEMACEADGGTWGYNSGCALPQDAGPSDALSDAVTAPDWEPSDAPFDVVTAPDWEPSDAPFDVAMAPESESSDALSDAVTSPDVVDIFCCNANPDPCCQSQYCGAPVTVECTQKMACEADGGTWNLVGGCALDGGTRDATSDAR